MLSDIISINSNASINPEQREERAEPYRIVHSSGTQFRVLTREYASKSSIVTFWCVFWSTSMLVVASLLLGKVEAVSSKLVFFSLLLSAIIFAAVTLYLRKRIEKALIYSVINFILLLVAVPLLALLKLKLMTYVSAALILAQLVVTGCSMKNKGKIAIEIILLGEIGLLAGKSDGFVNISWAQALVPLVPFFIFLTAAFILILIYSVLLHMYYTETFKSKRISLLFLLANLGCFSSTLSIPLSWAIFDLDITALCIIAMAFTSTNSIFLWIYASDMALHFCSCKQQILESQKSITIDLIPMSKSLKQKPLYRFSQNWFGNQVKNANIINTQYPQCLICTQKLSDIVWLPCGHMSLCTPCCKEIIENKMISCMLCKQKPTSICKLKGKDELEMKLDREMGLASSKVEAETVVQQYLVKIS